MNSKTLIEQLELAPHPEGGYYKEIFRSDIPISNGLGQKKVASTAIYYLLESTDFSTFHRITSDEGWHFYQGNSCLIVHEIQEDGTYIAHRLSNDLERGQFFSMINAGSWFAANLEEQESGNFALVGCTVAPGFEFEDFEIADARTLSKKYPQHQALIQQLSR
ncbi:cupin domain-containing protein [Persicobacter psychrovividus]|uniref:DUF985 domain-containing protein n=1 Tax=Persicobacter psychrovividus TaxID=387638 RepID=A0ABM7VIT6_9BACT|nr:hypothetical protein PEPS_31800 [Persicobacter psychrovividus]